MEDSTEIGVGDVTVNLLDSNLTEVASTTTAADGSYNFAELGFGWYSLEFVPRNEFTLSPMDRGDDDLSDSDANRSTGRTAPLYWNDSDAEQAAAVR